MRGDRVSETAPALKVGIDTSEWTLEGEWTIRRLESCIGEVRSQLARANASVRWNLEGLSRLDSFGATLLWRAWGQGWPEHIRIGEAHRKVIEKVAESSGASLPRPPRPGVLDLIAALGSVVLAVAGHLMDLVRLVGQLALDVAYLFRHPTDAPLKEITANIYKMGVKAMPVAALVGFLIGVVLSYLSALQLQAFGADIFIVNILGLGIIRELGPVLVSILVAGRSGSAMTAQLGVMRVTEEIDALSAMGISRTLRLVLPKVLALSFAMPLLVLWTSGMALFGGMLSAWIQMDLSMAFFIDALPGAVPIANLYIGLTKGLIFGLLIALIACHFGLRVKPNTESLSANTTASVVVSITMVILADAVLAIATRSIGVPL